MASDFTPAVVIPKISGCALVPDPNVITFHRSSFGWTWTSSNNTSDGFRPSLVYASADSTR